MTKHWALTLSIFLWGAARLLAQCPSLVDAAAKGDMAATTSLLAAGADPNCVTVTEPSIEGWTPLMAAAKAGSASVAKALLKAGANVNAKNGYGATPLDIAVAGHGIASDMVVAIFEAGGKGRNNYPISASSRSADGITAAPPNAPPQAQAPRPQVLRAASAASSSGKTPDTGGTHDQTPQGQIGGKEGTAQPYRSSTLPFTALLSMSAGGVVSETVGQDGQVHPSCGSLSTKALKLGNLDVPLKSPDVTDDCKIQTKDFGDVLLRMTNFATFSAQVLVTAKQEEAFKKFLAPAPSSSPQSSTGPQKQGTAKGTPSQLWAQAPAGQKAAPANQKQSAASPNAEQKFLCNSASFKEDHYWVNVGAKTVHTDQVVRGGPNGQDAWSMKDVSITEDAIKFTQKIDFGGVVLVRQVSINRKDGSFTNNGKTEGKCVVVDKF